MGTGSEFGPGLWKNHAEKRIRLDEAPWEVLTEIGQPIAMPRAPWGLVSLGKTCPTPPEPWPFDAGPVLWRSRGAFGSEVDGGGPLAGERKG